MFNMEVMDLVELTPLKNALVGLPGVNLSTEQRKRLTIAVEPVANPSIIFMDEPTSGPDARAAAIVMRTMRNAVDTGRTVVCAIHQPMGRHSCHLIAYFEVSCGDEIKAMGSKWRKIDIIKELSQPPPGSKELYFSSRYSQPFLIQCMACLWKQRQSHWRNTSYTAVIFTFTLVISLMFGTMFWKLGNKWSTPRKLSNAMGSMHAAVIFIGHQNSSSVQPVVDVERTVFYRELAAGMYSALAYAFSQAIVEIPYIFSQTVLYGVLVYAMISFNGQPPSSSGISSTCSSPCSTSPTPA
ncbi:hypothetical protein AAG906_004529 [Vitis piasezkii]